MEIQGTINLKNMTSKKTEDFLDNHKKTTNLLACAFWGLNTTLGYYLVSNPQTATMGMIGGAMLATSALIATTAVVEKAR